ncbi:MAG: diadenylate cyclase CdaA [Clostridia bacterium]|nr:diadenylate cyclase CdaA [Clostridia bacterium]
MVWERILGFLTSYNWITDTLDILLVALFVYFVIRLVRDSRAEQLVKGIAFLAILYLLSTLLGLTTVKYLLKAVFDSGLLVIVIIFQPEIRRALEQAGHSRSGIWRIFGGLSNVDSAAMIQQWEKAIHATAEAVETLQKQKMGALIVLERSTRLGEIVHTGTLLEAEPSGELIANIFFNKAPLHDGAMIIRDGKLYAAGCILPLSDNLQICRELGTRHRAGVGMSEDSDALVIILSEETGMISLADGGELQRNFTKETLLQALSDRLLWNQEEQRSKIRQRISHRNRKEKES